MSATAATRSGSAVVAAFTAVALLLIAMSMVAILSALVGQRGCATAADAAPSANAERGIPAGYLALYRQAGQQYAVPWAVLAAIGAIETDHGRSRSPGVHRGVNSWGCCAGPMQFNLRDGPPSTWDRYGVDGNNDGSRDVYDPADAIASAANYLRELLRQADGNLNRAVFGYTHSQAFVNDVLARARAYAGLTNSELVGPVGDPTVMSACTGGGI